VAIGSMAVKNEGKATPKSEGEASPSGSSCLRKEQVFYERKAFCQKASPKSTRTPEVLVFPSESVFPRHA